MKEMKSEANAALVASDLVQKGVQTFIQNTQRLGLQWNVRLATVTLGGVFSLNAAMDGDEEPIAMVSMIGQVSADARVYVASVNSGGNFVIGMVNPFQAGSEFISFTTQVSRVVNVTFTEPFLTPPNVHVNINSGSGSTANWHSRAINISTDTFQIFVFGPSSTWADVEVIWTAFAT